MKPVSIITVNYNNYPVTRELLRSIYRYCNYPNLEIIVVDNGSTYNPGAEIREEYGDVIYVRSEQNLGFAGGNNLGVRKASGDYLFFVNNDTEFTTGLVELLVETLDQNPSAGIVSPKIRYYDQPDVLQYVGFTGMNFFTMRNRCIGQYEKDKGQYDTVIGTTGYAHGAAMMIRRAAIENAGLMAENFFLYYEELDWCERIRKAGFDIWVNAKALIYHKESMAVGKRSLLKEYYMNRNRILFARKHASSFKYTLFLTYLLLLVIPRNLVVYFRNKEFGFAPILIKAVWWNFFNGVNSTKLYFPLSKTVINTPRNVPLSGQASLNPPA